jgi:hypothetical protein
MIPPKKNTMNVKNDLPAGAGACYL